MAIITRLDYLKRLLVERGQKEEETLDDDTQPAGAHSLLNLLETISGINKTRVIASTAPSTSTIVVERFPFFRKPITVCHEEFDVVKSALQKYCRRGNESGALWCCRETFLTTRMSKLKYASSTKSMMTNFVNRIKIILMEDVSFREVNRCILVMRLLHEFIQENATNPDKLMAAVIVVVESKKSRIGSHLWWFSLGEINNSTEKYKNCLMSVVNQLRVLNIVQFMSFHQAAVAIVPHLVYFYVNGGIKMKRHKWEPLWKELIECCNRHKNAATAMRMKRKFFEARSRFHDERAVLMSAILLGVYCRFYGKESKFLTITSITEMELINENYKLVMKKHVVSNDSQWLFHHGLEHPEYVYDMHTVRGRHENKTHTDFAQIGAHVENEDIDIRNDEWKEYYENYKKVLDTYKSKIIKRKYHTNSKVVKPQKQKIVHSIGDSKLKCTEMCDEDNGTNIDDGKMLRDSPLLAEQSTSTNDNLVRIGIRYIDSSSNVDKAEINVQDNRSQFVGTVNVSSRTISCRLLRSKGAFDDIDNHDVNCESRTVKKVSQWKPATPSPIMMKSIDLIKNRNQKKLYRLSFTSDEYFSYKKFNKKILQMVAPDLETDLPVLDRSLLYFAERRGASKKSKLYFFSNEGSDSVAKHMKRDTFRAGRDQACAQRIKAALKLNTYTGYRMLCDLEYNNTTEQLQTTVQKEVFYVMSEIKGEPEPCTTIQNKKIIAEDKDMQLEVAKVFLFKSVLGTSDNCLTNILRTNCGDIYSIDENSIGYRNLADEGLSFKQNYMIKLLFSSSFTLAEFKKCFGNMINEKNLEVIQDIMKEYGLLSDEVTAIYDVVKSNASVLWDLIVNRFKPLSFCE